MRLAGSRFRGLSAVLAAIGSVTVLGGGSVSAVVPSPPRSATAAPASSVGVNCTMGRGVQHVVNITFDNVHFFRDNPNVPSDLELMPHLEQFIEQRGTLLSNNHTPLIAHTGDDFLTTLTGLYGDRQGMPISNSYRTFNPDGTTDPARSFAYWTDPVYNTASSPTPGHDANPSMVYSPAPPATTHPAPEPNTETPAPWVPFTRAGCNVGAVATPNLELQNNRLEIPQAFGAGSPEANQLASDTDPSKGAETADYLGLAVHCGRGSPVCADARGVKNGQSTVSPTAVPDPLPDEPGGYAGYQALFGHRYIAPVLGAGTPDVVRHGYAVTNSSGNLVDLDGNQLDGALLTNHPGFPGFGSINASQTLAYLADLLESNVPVVYGYISDLHDNEDINDAAVQAACAGAGDALGSGSPCYIAQARYYDQAFEAFFQRLAADGITPANTEFVFSSDEGDHEAAANVGRAVQPTPADCNGATVSGLTVVPGQPCSYAPGTIGALDGNVTGLLASEKSNTTPFTLQADTAPEFYVTGRPKADSPTVRRLEHDAAGLTADNPYAGEPNQQIANYLADPTEEAILHMVNADPARTPTFSLFAKPDYFLFNGGTTCPGSTAAGCVSTNDGFVWDHGGYAAEIDTNWLGLVGPGVANRGLDGSGPSQGPSSAGADSGQVTVPDAHTRGTWLDETDIRPTLMYLVGLRDDYLPDGRVVSQVLSTPSPALETPGFDRLESCYKQINSSVGQFGTDTLRADTNAVESSSVGDATYRALVQGLRSLEQARDVLIGTIKTQLDGAAFGGRAPSPGTIGAETSACRTLLRQANEILEQS